MHSETEKELNKKNFGAEVFGGGEKSGQIQG